MKKIVTLFVCLLSIQFAVKASDHKAIEFDQLPELSQQLINNHFSGQSIALIKVDKEIFETTYEVIFTNGNKIEFDKKGVWKDIESKYAPMPLEVIPLEIRNFVSKKFPDTSIIKIEKESKNRYEVELSNKIEIKFDSKYNVIDIER